MGGGGESVEVSLLQGFTFKIHFGDVNFGVSSSFGDLGEDEVPMVDLLGVGVLREGFLLLLGGWFISLD